MKVLRGAGLRGEVHVWMAGGHRLGVLGGLEGVKLEGLMLVLGLVLVLMLGLVLVVVMWLLLLVVVVVLLLLVVVVMVVLRRRRQWVLQ